MSPPEIAAGSDEAALLRRLAATPELFEAIAAEHGTEFQLQARLRERFPAELVRMALEVSELRRKAAGKFAHASRMWLTRQGLEQATPELVARHKAARFAGASGDDPVWDLCCGIGGDAIALSQVREVIAVDADPAQTLRTELNVALYQPNDPGEHRSSLAPTSDTAFGADCPRGGEGRGEGGQKVAPSPQPSPPQCDSVEIGSRLAGERGPPVTLRISNARGPLSYALQTCVANVTTLPLDGALIHIDPDRRAHGQRVLRLEQYAPPLEWLQELTERARGGAIKVSPASNFGGKFPDAEIELISLDGECKEATVWFGELRGEAPWRATLLPSGATLAGHPLDALTDVRPIGRYLYDPDPAVVRAGLVDLLARDLGLWRLDAAEEYLSSEQLIDTPFCAAFEVLAVLPNNATQIRRAVAEQSWGQIEIKCRHVKVDADAERRKLPLAGIGAGVLFFARLEGKTKGVLARRVSTLP